MRLSNNRFVQAHPAAAAALATLMVASPLAGFAMTAMDSHAAELATVPAVQMVRFDSVQPKAIRTVVAEGADVTNNGIPDVVAQTPIVTTRDIHFFAEGPGHIEPVDNCVIDGMTGTITILDSSIDAHFRLVADVGGAVGIVRHDADVLESVDAIVTLTPVGEYDLMTIEFTMPITDIAPMTEPVYEEPLYTEFPAAAPVEETYYYYVVDGDGNVISEGVPASDAPATTPHSMTNEEMAVANDIFIAYNDFRAGRGLPMMGWDDTCANMAYASALGCAEQNALIHRLGIPGEAQDRYSDILQYSTWKMTGAEAVDRWRNSAGHRRMMQCDSAKCAAVATYLAPSGKWYYVIVYNFDGCNQSGD